MNVAKVSDGAIPQAETISKSGYSFDPADDSWKLSKDIVVTLHATSKLSLPTQRGFRQTLQRYAEELSAAHTYAMAERVKRYMRDTGASTICVEELLNWRSMLGSNEQWQMGGLKGFLLAWHDFGFEGISKDVVDLLLSWRIKGNEKGVAVASGCPKSGPYTDIEMSALMSWANSSVSQGLLKVDDYAYLMSLSMTARRSVQITSLRGKDLIRDVKGDVVQFYLNCPRAKQRNTMFRGEFNSIAIIEDLYLILQHQHRKSVSLVEAAIGGSLSAKLIQEVPIFLNEKAIEGAANAADVERLLLGSKPDALHARTLAVRLAMQRCSDACQARSERTGEPIQISATRFRRTRGTKLRREGFGPLVIAELLDHSDTQNVGVYTQNTAQEASVINELIGAQLAPFAQACLGTLVLSERDAVRGEDPNSRVANDRQNGVGTCGNYGFCASSYRACYTCYHFQPWLDGPHEEVLSDLYADKERARAAGCADVIVDANDLLILAVEHCVALCRDAKISMRSAKEIAHE